MLEASGSSSISFPIGLVEWNGILESEISIIDTRSDLGFHMHVLYCIGIKSVIASNNCTNSDAGIYQCDAVKGGCSSFVLNITMKKLLFAESWSVQYKRRCDRVNHLLLL